MPNVELLTKVLHYIEDHLEEWDQTLWGSQGRTGGPACGPTFCFGGHTSVTFTGDEPLWIDKAVEIYDVQTDTFELHTCRIFEEVIVAGTDRRERVGKRAQELLGLTSSDVECLFVADNKLDDLRSCVSMLVEHGEIPWPYQADFLCGPIGEGEKLPY